MCNLSGLFRLLHDGIAMIQAEHQDKQRVVQILAHAFIDNKSVNYVIKGGGGKMRRIKGLMAYCFDVCFNYGKVYLSEDRNACALIIYPHQKHYSLKHLWWDLKLAITVSGIFHLPKLLKRETVIDNIKGKQPHLNLWFIGVDPTQQQKGIGTKLMSELLEKAKTENLPIYLEIHPCKHFLVSATWF